MTWLCGPRRPLDPPRPLVVPGRSPPGPWSRPLEAPGCPGIYPWGLGAVAVASSGQCGGLLCGCGEKKSRKLKKLKANTADWHMEVEHGRGTIRTIDYALYKFRSSKIEK